MRHLQVLVLIVPCLLAGCITSSGRSGVENRWRAESAPRFIVGTTTRAEVLTALGPPSQLIRLDGGMCLYYLTEDTGETSIILVLFNSTWTKTRYDRAIFFFDEQGVLTEFSTSVEPLEYDGEE